MAAELQISRRLFPKHSARVRVQFVKLSTKIDEMGARLSSFPHKRLEARSEFKLRVGDYRVLYEFDLKQGRVYLHYVGNRRDIYQHS